MEYVGPAPAVRRCDCSRAGVCLVPVLAGGGDRILDKYFDASGQAIGMYAHVGMGMPHQGRGFSMVDLILGLWITGQSHITVYNEARFDAAVRSGQISPVEAEHAEHQIREITTAIAHKRFPPALVRNFAIIPKSP